MRYAGSPSWHGSALLGVLALLLPLAGLTLLAGYVESAGTYVQSLGGWGFALFSLLGAVLCGLAILPTHAISLLAGFALGLTWGGPAAIVAVVLGAAIGHAAAGWMSGTQLATIIQKRRVGRVLWHAMVGVGGWRSMLAIALVRLPPQVPFALCNVVAAGAGVPRGPFLLGTLLGMAPRVLAVVWAGSLLQSWTTDQPVPAAMWLGAGGAIIGFIGLGWWAWRVLRQMPDDAPAPTPDPVSPAPSSPSTPA